MELLDIHTHHAAPQPQGVVALRFDGKQTESDLMEAQAYSAGIHPWDTINEISEAEWEGLERILRQPQVVAVGECGLDLTPNGGPMFRQLQVFKRHVELSEQLGKPMVIHDVKAHDMIVGCRRDLHPKQNWAIHGFRGKPEAAQMLLRKGCYLSFGLDYNSETLKEMPEDRILAETDANPVTIQEVIAKISQTLGKDMTQIIAENTKRFFAKEETMPSTIKA